MKSVRCARPVRRGIGEWIDNLQLLDDRGGPDRSRVFAGFGGGNIEVATAIAAEFFGIWLPSGHTLPNLTQQAKPRNPYGSFSFWLCQVPESRPN
jgi:hypothetical protein